MNDMQSEMNRVRRLSFSTESLGAEKWREVVCSFYAGLSIDWVMEQPRPTWLGLRRFADAQIMEIASQRPVRVISSSSPAKFTDTYNLALLAAGNCRSRHAGHEEVWQTGDMMLFDSSQSFNILHPGEYHILSWNLPREAIAPMLVAPDRSMGVRIPGCKGPGAVLANYVRALLTESNELDANAQRVLLTHLYGLIGLALGATPAAHQSRRETKRAVHRQQILAYIDAHLHDPRLTARQAAEDLNISLRWLHALLEDGGISFAAWVNRRRLQESQQILSAPIYDYLTIPDIAFQLGFGSLSTFNRRFRAQYGMTPREMRHLAQQNNYHEEK